MLPVFVPRPPRPEKLGSEKFASDVFSITSNVSTSTVHSPSTITGEKSNNYEENFGRAY